MDLGIKAFQIYYDESQKGSLMDGFIPYFNKKATINLESGIICDLVNQGEHLICDWFGVFSWKHGTPKRKKIKWFTFKRLHECTTNGIGVDIIAPMPSSYRSRSIRRVHYPRRQMNWARKAEEEKFWNAFDLLIKKLGIPDDKVLQGSGYAIYQNAFIARPQIYQDFVNSLLKPAIEKCHTDAQLSQLVTSEFVSGYLKPPQNFINDTGFEYYPMIPFILERLINVYIELNNTKVAWKL